MNKVGMISLGCSKNRVDSEILLGYLRDLGFEMVQSSEQAEILIVNTCGFITSAKEESIQTVLEMARYRQEESCKLLVVTGCLTQRYMQELMAEMPEVDLFWGVHDYDNLAAKIASLAGRDAASCRYGGRLLTTPGYSAYLRIADGCSNNCTYCAIPIIRGPRNSVPMENLLLEAQTLAEGGVRELTVIAQDTSGYGVDIYGKPMLSALLKKLTRVDGLDWIRLLYTYPDTVDEELIDTIAAERKLLNYIDMPIQHISDRLLRAMNRRGDSEHIKRIIGHIRAAAPDFIIRTTFIVGFPGETEQEFGQLTDFLSEYELDRVGAFAYSPEDGTAAAELCNQLDEEVKQARLDALMGVQQVISRELNAKRVGSIYDVLLTAQENGWGYGRTYAEAPEVDGLVKFKLAKGEHEVGQFYRVRMTEAGAYDLKGEEQ